MQWNSESRQSRWERITHWHKWFAWHPIRVGEEIVWLEWVERFYADVSGGLESGYYEWVYRNLEQSENKPAASEHSVQNPTWPREWTPSEREANIRALLEVARHDH